jgi:hypothetical protein
LFYKGSLTAEAYLSWLGQHGVDHVARPVHGQLDFGSTREGALLRGPVDGLTEVWRDADWVVYTVDDAVPLVDAPVEVLRTDRTRLQVRMDGPGSVAVNVRWSRWLTVQGPACVEPEGDLVRLTARHAGVVTIGSSLRPHGHC